MNKIIIFATILLILGIGGVVWGVSDSSKGSVANQEQGEVAGVQESENEALIWQDENARVMYFYSDDCSWCKKQKPILEELASEGEQYRWKPMNVGERQEYWEQYEIGGTPEFIDGKTGKRLEGYKEKEALKEWMDELVNGEL